MDSSGGSGPELLEACRRGDREAWRELYEAHKDRVYSIALYYFHGDGAAAADATQQVFLKGALACGDDASVQMTGTAEGLVKGQRQSVTLELLPMSTPGVFAVRKQWSDGTWVVNLTATCPGRKATAGALVALDQNSALLRGKTKLLERAATEREVAALLKDVTQTE